VSGPLCQYRGTDTQANSKLAATTLHYFIFYALPEDYIPKYQLAKSRINVGIFNI
jgi:hypothetical protein